MKIATIGTGVIVEQFIRSLEEINGAQCKAIFSRNIEKARDFAKRNNIDRYFDDLNLLLSDIEVDTIYVASPNSLHFKHAQSALNAGKNVICEKPFTSNTHELLSLIELAKAKNLFLFEAITTVHMPNYSLLKEKVNNVGQIKFVQCNYSQYSKKYDSLKSGGLPNIFNPDFSGGALMDINVYNIHFVVGLFGDPVFSNYYPNLHDNGIDTSGLLVMKYKDFIVSAVGCKDSTSMNFVLIQGEKGYIHVINGANGCESVYLSTDGSVTHLNEQNTVKKMTYEISKFHEIIENKDYPACHKLLDHSKTVIDIITNTRKKIGISFPADVV